MRELSKFKALLYLSSLTALTSLISTPTIIGLPETIKIISATASIILINTAERIMHIEGRNNKKEYLLENTKQATELLILSSCLTLYNNFAPIETFYLLLTLVSVNYILQSNKERIIGERKKLKTTYNQRTILILLATGLNLLTPVIGFYIILFYTFIQLYQLYLFKNN